MLGNTRWDRSLADYLKSLLIKESKRKWIFNPFNDDFDHRNIQHIIIENPVVVALYSSVDWKYGKPSHFCNSHIACFISGVLYLYDNVHFTCPWHSWLFVTIYNMIYDIWYVIVVLLLVHKSKSLVCSFIVSKNDIWHSVSTAAKYNMHCHLFCYWCVY